MSVLAAVPMPGRAMRGRTRAFALCAVALLGVAAPSLAEVEAAPAGAAACTGCHAAAAGTASPLPPLAGMGEADLVRTMQEFRSGARVATVMDRIARGFSDAEIQAIARWYARLR